MTGVTSEIAVERARTILAIDAWVVARAVYVERADHRGTGYYLVVFGEEGRSLGVAAVDATTGEVVSHAPGAGTSPHLPVAAARACELAGAAPIEPPLLVWRPCRASQSMLSPIWELRTIDGPIYVDQQGQLWERLEPAGPGGLAG
jgi:hypothetical protein